MGAPRRRYAERGQIVRRGGAHCVWTVAAEDFRGFFRGGQPGARLRESATRAMRTGSRSLVHAAARRGSCGLSGLEDVERTARRERRTTDDPPEFGKRLFRVEEIGFLDDALPLRFELVEGVAAGMG